MADNPELRVVQVLPRRSGATTYVLNCHSVGNAGRLTVFHSKKGSICCMNPACGGVFIEERKSDPRYKGCAHTRCVMAYIAEHDEPEGDDVVHVGAAADTQDLLTDAPTYSEDDA